MQNIEWLQEQLGDEDDDYLLFDCPGELILLYKTKGVNSGAWKLSIL